MMFFWWVIWMSASLIGGAIPPIDLDPANAWSVTLLLAIAWDTWPR